MSSTQPGSSASWFPAPPLKPPKPISLPKVLAGILIPLGVIAVIVVLILTQHSVKRSVAAFDSCVRTHETTGSRHNPTNLEHALQECENYLPKGKQVPGGAAQPGGGPAATAPAGSDQAFSVCMRQQVFGRIGPLGFHNVKSLRNAMARCRAFANSAAAGGSRPAGPSTPSTPSTPPATTTSTTALPTA